ncbi:MAG TPA: glycosyltransferase family 9 protein [Bacteroidota bacterium]|nr:glycosyltransferase family 9 protein [Bacteroidota bacterium]
MQGVLHKTLIIRLSSVGDVVLSSPLVRALHGRFPDCQIDFLVKSEYADLVRCNPHVAHVIQFPGGGTIRDLVRLRRTVLSSGYDLIIDIHDSLRSRYLSAGAGKVTRVNKRKIARTLLVNFKLDVYARFGGAPDVAARYLETVVPWGVADDGRGPELFFPGDVREAVERLMNAEGLAPGSRCIGVCPCARHGNKMWPADRFAESAGHLAERRGLPVLLFGGTDEKAMCEAVGTLIRAAHPRAGVLNLAGRLSLLETGCAMDRCAVVLANDTGLMHIAEARGVPVVAIFGPTVREFGFSPRGARSAVVEHPGLSCRPCTHIGLPRCPRGHFRCMKEITVGAVTDVAERFLAQ